MPGQGDCLMMRHDEEEKTSEKMFGKNEASAAAVVDIKGPNPPFHPSKKT